MRVFEINIIFDMTKTKFMFTCLHSKNDNLCTLGSHLAVGTVNNSEPDWTDVLKYSGRPRQDFKPTSYD